MHTTRICIQLLPRKTKRAYFFLCDPISVCCILSHFIRTPYTSPTHESHCAHIATVVLRLSYPFCSGFKTKRLNSVSDKELGPRKWRSTLFKSSMPQSALDDKAYVVLHGSLICSKRQGGGARGKAWTQAMPGSQSILFACHAKINGATSQLRYNQLETILFIDE